LRPEERVHRLKWIFFPWLVEEFASFGVDRPEMACDLSEVVFLEGEAQRLQKLGYLIGGLIGKIRGEGKVEGGVACSSSGLTVLAVPRVCLERADPVVVRAHAVKVR